VLDRYVVIERIAVGGMGEVFVARQQGVGNFRRIVVLKKLLPDVEGSDEAARRMLDEARIHGALVHENVVTVLEVGTERQLPWIALEYVHGENAGALRARAARLDRDMPLLVVGRIVADCARGLQHAHDAHDVDGRPLRIIHRDIAPKNLFVRVDGVSKVGDFGVARADDRLTRTATGALAGTLSYMSPEQLSHQPLTPASDQFALGIVLWELLAGRRLFQRDGLAATVEQILHGRVQPPSRARPDVPPALDAIALRMLERDPARRFADCAAVAAALEAAFPGVSAADGRAAVAAFVEDVAGHDLRERLRRIEEGAEQTTRRDRDATLTASSAPDVDATSVSGSDEATLRVPPTRALVLDDGPAAATTRATRPDIGVGVDREAGVRRDGARRRARALVAGAAALAAMVVGLFLVVGGGAGGRGGADTDALTRAHLREAARVRPLTFREAVVDDAIAWEIAEPEAEQLAARLQVLMRERFALWITHHDKPSAARQATFVDAVARDQQLLARVREALSPWGDAEFRERIFRVWQVDSAVPYRFLPGLTHVELQRRIFPNGIAYMKETREQRWSQVARLSRRAGVTEAQVRTVLEPLVAEREALLERYGTAAADELPALERQVKLLRSRGRAGLQGMVVDDVADALIAAAFIGVPDTEQGEAQIDEKAVVVFGS
jgi:hypothetical protein